MSRYYEIVSRADSAEAARQKQAAETGADVRGLPQVMASTPAELLQNVQFRLARASGIVRLTESFAPSATAENPVRLMVSGCRPGDGASSVAVGMAIDLSQRLGLRTLVVDAHLRHPTLRGTLLRHGHSRAQSWVMHGMRLHSTGWPRLQLATFGWVPEDRPGEFFESVNGLLNEYPVTVIDLGVLRLDASMLALARPMDPIVLVARYAHTERGDLASTIRALQAADRSLAGVIFNAKAQVMPAGLRWLFGGGE